MVNLPCQAPEALQRAMARRVVQAQRRGDHIFAAAIDFGIPWKYGKNLEIIWDWTYGHFP